MVTYLRNDLAKSNPALAVYAFGNLAVFLVLMALGYRDAATVLAILSFLVFAFRRVLA